MALVFATGLLVAAMVFFAIQLADSQADSKSEIEQRFRERPEITASLTESLFAATTTSAGDELEAQFSGDVTDADMTAVAKEDNNVFSALYDDQGELIALSENATPEAIEELESDPPYVQGVLEGQPIAISDILDLGEGAEGVTAFAQGIDTDSGERVLVNGLPPLLLATFLGQYLAEVPTVEGGESFILDSINAVVASSSMDVAPGDPVDVPGLDEALMNGDYGAFGDDQYFASTPVENSEWKVVSTAPESTLFEPVSGWNKWTPWLIFTAFALAGLAALGLLRRVSKSAGELAEAHEQLEVTNRALERRAKELEQSNAELDQFASIASHDLQEPLRKVQMFSEKVAESESDTLSEKGQDYLRRSSDAAGRMQQLIQDLLDFSRVATRARPPVETDLGELTREVVSDLEGPIEEAEATIEVGDLPTVRVDRPQIRQLLQNLISNAIKFRREGVPPEVRVEGSQRGRFVEVSVADNGIGIDPQYSSRIFRVFERLHGRGEYPGTGIGLALARKIAERHGGTMSVDSSPGNGSTFTFTLLDDEETESVATPATDQREEES